MVCTYVRTYMCVYTYITPSTFGCMTEILKNILLMEFCTSLKMKCVSDLCGENRIMATETLVARWN